MRKPVPKPTANSEFLSRIPAELRNPPLWLQYYLKQDATRPEKKPRKQPIVKWGTAEDRKANLRSLDYLLAERAGTKHDGFQRFIDKTEGFVYIDLDHCRNADSGEIEPWAREILNEIDSYCEISASGKGLHIVCRGTLPEDFHVDPKEIYSGNSGKLMAMTGNVLESYAKIEGRQERVEKLLSRWKAESKVQTAENSQSPQPIQERHWRDVFHTGSELDSAPSLTFIKGILEEGITYFGALSGTGKTWIGLSIAHALLSGQPLFGTFPVLQKTNVLYLVPEMGGRKFRQRMEKMRIAMDGGFYCQTVRDGVCNLDDPALLQAIHMMHPTVILDTAIRFQEGDEQSSTQQAQGLGAKLFRLIREGAPMVIGMHHRKKDVGDTTPTLENTLRGTGDFGAMADCVWCVEHARRKKGKNHDKEYEEESKLLTRLTLTCVKPRDMEPADPFTIQGRPHIDKQGDFVVIDTTREEEPSTTDDSRVISVVEKDPTIGLGSIRRQTGFGTDKISRILEENNFKKLDGKWARLEVMEVEEQPY
jgi:AAA domain